MTSAFARMRGLLYAALLLVAAIPAAGQIFSASVTGLVTDPNAAVIPGADVTISNVGTQDTRSASTGPEGRFNFSSLLPGVYELRVESPGFKAFVRSEIRLQGSQDAEIDVQLELGEVTETVEVTAAAVMLDTQSANQTASLDRSEITEMPLSFRNPLALVHTNAGVFSSFANSGRLKIRDRVRDQNWGLFSMNGGREGQNTIQVDGLSNKGGDWGSTFGTPGVDSVQEMQISRNTYDAEYARTGNGVVSIVTRGGSGDVHGSLFWFLRNDNLDANSWARNRANNPRPEFKRNQFGGNVSGPMWKSKRLYGMFGFEGTRIPSAQSILVTVPTSLERQGDFSESFDRVGGQPSLQRIFDPFTTRPNPDGPGFVRDQFQNNIIPQSRMDTVGSNVATKLYPAPNQTGVPITNANNFFGTGGLNNTADRYDIRGDWAQSQKYSMFLRMTRTLFGGTRPRIFNTGGDTGDDNTWPYYQVTMSNTIVPSPTWVINALVGAGGTVRNSTGIGTVDGFQLTDVGYPQSFQDMMQTTNTGQYSPANYTTVGRSRNFKNARRILSFSVNVTNERGAHSLKFGMSGENLLHNIWNAYTIATSFNRGMTSGPVAAAASATSGNSIASLLLGTGTGGSTPVPVPPATSQRYFGWYAQDTWRVNNRLTLNLGVRYELQNPRTERYNQQNYFDYDARSPLNDVTGYDELRGGLVFSSPTMRGQTYRDNFDLAPRIGIAYQATNRLVVRAGYGISYSRSFTDSGPNGNDGFSVTTPWIASQASDGITPGNPLSNPYPNGLDPVTGATDGLLTRAGNSVTAWRLYNPTPYLQNYSFDLQYQAGYGTIVEVGYTGNVGRKFSYGEARRYNQMFPEYLSMGEDLNTRVSNPFYGHINIGALRGQTIPRHRLLRTHPQFINVNSPRSEKGANSSFNALHAKVTRRFSDGLTLITSYQWSKALDNASEDQGWFLYDGFRNVFDAGTEWGVSGHDLPHDFVTSMIYELPVGQGRQFGSGMSGVADAVLGGWQVSAIVRFASGNPIGLRAPNTLGPFGFGVQRPIISDYNDLKVANRTPERWFNIDAVSAPGKFEIGSAPRYLPNIRIDGTTNADIALMKNFYVGELLRVQFRAEAFNLANTPQFGLRSTGAEATVGSGAFGTVRDTFVNDARSLQFGLKVYF
ncbi:MAG: carboxypeptidase regulatory-like domain-containing protein [Bryobacterales bacterium]|nr:carboxypeptidase regulatory-like domain-containing protein [Bryobacterales bacterium]